METYNRNLGTASGQQPERRPGGFSRSGRLWSGLFIVVIGLLLLADRAGMFVPSWLISFKTLLIALGLFLGIRSSFRNFVWTIPMAIGLLLLAEDFFPLYNIKHFGWPLIIIGIGIFIMLRAGKKNSDWRKSHTRPADEQDTAEDYLDSTVVFGGVKKNIISKDFRGGDVVTVFGGTEINLMQADLTGSVVLELTQVFGGTKLIVPPHWKIWSKDMVAILGGIDDKRPMLGNVVEENNKTLILKGTCMLGGIEIRSY